jgi:tRNA (cytidine32/uridine32-2'-O)-methyltransferase
MPNESATIPSRRPPVRFVLVRPETPANVGACARVVRNGGLEGLDLVAPGDWRTVECWRTAWGAQDVLEQARVHDSLPAALAEATWVAGLSGRPAGTGGVSLDVREMAEQVAGLGPDQRVAVVLGPETTGLTRDELAVCGRLVAIPSHPAQPSLNLSHAAAVAAYEIYRAEAAANPRPRRASHGEKAAMVALVREGLLRIEALPPRDTDRYFREWEALFLRADLTPKEVRLLEHMARKMAAAAPATLPSR